MKGSVPLELLRSPVGSCVGGTRPTPDKLSECAATPALQNAAKDRRNCIVAAATPDKARDCLTNGLDPPHAKLTECLAKAQSGGAAVGCLDVISVDY
jgi:hypothetical protein